MMNSDSSAQTSKFDELWHKMFFNIFLHKPDSSVFDFVKKYFPAFTEKPEPGGWTVYPPGPFPDLQYTVHSLNFKKHPYFETKFRMGRLDILASEEKGGSPGVKDFQLWFMFDTKDDAQNAFAKLSNMFDTLSKSKRIFEKNGRTIAQYSDQADEESPGDVLIILTNDELQDNKYKVFFKLGRYEYLE